MFSDDNVLDSNDLASSQFARPEVNVNRLAAGGGLTIETRPDVWRLLINGDKVLLEAVSAGQPIYYSAMFASQRRLPPEGLSTDDIQRVVVGWSVKDESWHLGLMLEPQLADQRGNRWVELAGWSDPDTDLFDDTAVQAGERLAAQIGRAFNRVEPRPLEQRQSMAIRESRLPASEREYSGFGADRPAVSTAFIPPAAVMPALPIHFDLWTLAQSAPQMLTLSLSNAWGRAKLVRAGWYIVWAGVFTLLAIASLTSGIAFPRMGTLTLDLPNQPPIDIAPPALTLVIAGFVCAGLLIIAALVNIIRAASAIKRIEIDGQRGLVRGMKGRRAAWSIPASAMQSVYASQIVTRATPVKRSGGEYPTRNVRYGELLLHLSDDQFKHLISQSTFDDKLPAHVVDANAITEAINQDRVSPLLPQTAYTPLQAAAVLTAQALNLPARYDERVK